MIIEPPLRELKGRSRLALGFFNSLINRIECTKPLPGNNVFVRQYPDGIQVNVSANVVTLNVCSNGTPSTLAVFSPLT
jgi:hypothetical protein